MGKIVRNILDPAVVKTIDGILRNRHVNRERASEEVRKNDALLTPDGRFDVTSREAQRGRMLSRAEFVRRISKMNPNLWYEQSVRFPSQGGLYVADLTVPYGKRMVASFPHDHIGEFSLRITVPEVVPAIGNEAQWMAIRRVDQQEPGWRSVLLKLIMDGLITPAGAEKEFKISQGRSSGKWQQTGIGSA